VTHISRVNCAEMARDRLRQPAYEIFAIELNVASACYNKQHACAICNCFTLEQPIDAK